MTNRQIELIQQSWLLVKPIGKQAGLLFYERLFVIAPSVRHLFKADITEQAGKLIMILGYVVAKLNRPEEIINDLKQLGIRHQQYGAKEEHYDVVGQCLIATLKDALQNKWNDELQEAWQNAFMFLKSIMTTAAPSDLAQKK